VKPNNVVDLWLFGKECPLAAQNICNKWMTRKYICPSFQSFARVITIDDEVTDELCGLSGGEGDRTETILTECRSFWKNLADADEDKAESICDSYRLK